VGTGRLSQTTWGGVPGKEREFTASIGRGQTALMEKTVGSSGKGFVVAVALAICAWSCDRVVSTHDSSVASIALITAPTSMRALVTSVPWSCLSPNVLPDVRCTARASLLVPRSVPAVTAPAAPIALIGSAAGNTVTLTWTLPSTSDVASSYIVEAGSAPSLADLANFDTGEPATSLIASGVPAGTYYVRVRAKNTVGVSPPSNEVVITVGSGSAPCASAPNAPSGLAASAVGATVTLLWSAPIGGCPPTGYVIEAGSAPGLANLANENTGTTVTSFTAGGVGNGTYYVRVRAANPIGLSAASNEATLIVGSAPTPPPPPPPPPSPSGLTCGGSPVPSLVPCINNQPPQAPTAVCNDGVYSCSQTRSGTCSGGHGGVRCYVCPGPLC